MFAYCVLGVFVLMLYGVYNVITIEERSDVEKSKGISKNKANEISDMLALIYGTVTSNKSYTEDLTEVKNKISNIESQLSRLCDYIEESKNNNKKL